MPIRSPLKSDACTLPYPCAHCDASVGCGQGGGVVHTVTGHRDLVAFLARNSSISVLSSGGTPARLVDTELPATSGCAVRSLSPLP
jgi:hypothetical protein